jgi:5'-methylthioadenosine phosphorylase
MDGVRVIEECDVPTPWGMPSDLIAVADIRGEAVAFLPRHGRGHRYLPSEVPSHANIWALKSLGVEQIVSASAVGSLSDGYAPGEFVVCDSLVDRTSRRASYFGAGVVGHVGFADPFCPGIRKAMGDVLVARAQPHHQSGTYICMEGPAFSSRAESELHRSWRAELIGMTAAPEAKLAREAEICYATMAMITDYDCWKAGGEDVSVSLVVETMRRNTAALLAMLPDLVALLAHRGDCPCRHAAEHAVMTDTTFIPYDTRRKLALFYQKYWQKEGGAR